MNYEKTYITVFYIDIRNYTKLSKLKDPKIVVDFILEYRKSIDGEFEKIKNEVKYLHKINIGDAVLIIFQGIIFFIDIVCYKNDFIYF